MASRADAQEAQGPQKRHESDRRQGERRIHEQDVHAVIMHRSAAFRRPERGARRLTTAANRATILFGGSLGVADDGLRSNPRT
jgi:hypothetical protein